MPATLFKISLYTVLTVLLLSSSSCGRSNSSAGALPELEMPETWQNQHQEGQDIDEAWLHRFDDQALLTFLEQALNDNFDLKIQLARWQQFQARSRIAGADRLPQASLSAGVSRRFQEQTFVNDYSTDYSVTGSISWEIDLWNKLGDRTQAAVMLEEAAAADYQSLRLSIAARIAQAWYACCHSHMRVQLLEENLKAWDKTVRNAEIRFANGTSSALDLQRILQVRSADAAQLHEAQQEYRQRQRDLELIAGRYPAGLIEISNKLPELKEAPASGLPSSLINRRYDVAAARQRYLSKVRLHSAAQKDLIPSFRLTAEGGYSSDELSSVFKPESLLWNLFAGLTQPLFQGGRLRATVDLRHAETSELAAYWAQTVLQAFHDVESALSNEQFLRQIIVDLQTSVEHAERSHAQAQQQYSNGIISITAVLEIERAWLSSQIRLLAARHALITNRIDLHRALGGDFTLADPEADMEADNTDAP